MKNPGHNFEKGNDRNGTTEAGLPTLPITKEYPNLIKSYIGYRYCFRHTKDTPVFLHALAARAMRYYVAH